MAKMIQIRHVPDVVHRKLKARAALEGLSLSDYLRRQVTEWAARPTQQEWLQRLAIREPVSLPGGSAAAVRAERESR